MNNEILLPNRCHEGHQDLKSPVFMGFFEPMKLLPLNCKNVNRGDFSCYEMTSVDMQAAKYEVSHILNRYSLIILFNMLRVVVKFSPKDDV